MPVTIQTLNAKINALQGRLALIVGGGGGIPKASWSAGNIQTFTTTGGGRVPLTTGWPIPAGDASVGTVYRVWTFGDGTTTSNLLGIDGNAFGGNMADSGWAAGVYPNSTNFSWEAWFTVVIGTTGASGTARASFRGWASVPGRTTNTANEIHFGGNSASPISINTTVATTMFVEGAFSTSGTINSYGSVFERLGS